MEEDRPRLDGVDFKKISCDDNLLVLVQFGDVEVKGTVWECGDSNSLGLDGYNFKFIKAFWNILKKDIMRFLKEYHDHGVFPRGYTSSFISFIFKAIDPQNLGEFRPVSLLGSMYKILANILSNRLKRVLDKVINSRQNTFLAGRQLQHRVLVANKVVEEAKRLKTKCLIFKVDYEKAYYLVS